MLRDGIPVRDIYEHTAAPAHVIRRAAGDAGLQFARGEIAADLRSRMPAAMREKVSLRQLTIQGGALIALRHSLYCLDADCDHCLRIEEMVEDLDFDGYDGVPG